MTTLRTIWPAGRARALALLLAGICLWMGTGVALVHTEDLRPLLSARTFSRGPVSDSHAAPHAALDLCLACQWEGMASNPQTPGIHIPSPPPADLPLPEALPALPLSAAVRHARPRGPPRPVA